MNDGKSTFFSPRMAAALLWLLVPLSSFPLAFCRLGGAKLPFWGSVTGAGTAEMGVLSLALILLFPERLTALGKRSRFFRCFLGSAALFLLACTLQQFLFRDGWRCWETALFYAAAPLAAAALGPELKRIFPFAAAAECLLLIVSGFSSAHFSGFCGNWNWTQALILALFPSIFLSLFFQRPWRWSAVALPLFFLLLALLYPQEFSRAAFPVMGAAALLLILLQKKEWRLLPLFLFSGLILLFLLLLWFLRGAAESRIQLWVGSLALGLRHFLLGSGMGRYEFLVGETMPELYFFSRFAAPLHLHPHNELLWFFCGGGIAGLLYLAMIFSALLRKKAEDRNILFCRWTALTLLLWGMVDMPAAIPLGAWWFLSAAGVCLGREETAEREARPAPGRTVAAALLLLWAVSHAAVNFRSGLALREGRLALLHGKTAKAKTEYLRSVRLRPGREAFYELACCALEREKDWGSTLRYLQKMEENGTPFYLHSARLKALALANLGDIPRAREALAEDAKRFPASLIDARLMLELAPEEEQSAALARFQLLCQRRNVPPDIALELTPEADDSADPVTIWQGEP